MIHSPKDEPDAAIDFEARADLEARARLIELLEEFGQVAVALSGGVDSALLLAVARAALGDGAVGATGVSPSLSTDELMSARTVALALGVPLLEIATHELERPEYVANAGDRCFHCKTELYGLLAGHPQLRGRVLVDGTHAEDPSGDRPGMRAASEQGVRSPLREAGLGKRAIRAWARELGLPNWSRPARPCLASRVGIGTEVTTGRLETIAALETILAEEAFRVFRARIDGELVVIQLGRAELSRLPEPRWRTRIVERARALGISRVLFDEDGYRAPGEPRSLARRWVELETGERV